MRAAGIDHLDEYGEEDLKAYLSNPQQAQGDEGTQPPQPQTDYTPPEMPKPVLYHRAQPQADRHNMLGEVDKLLGV